MYEHYLLDHPELEQITEHYENPFYEMMEKNLEVDINKVLKRKDYLENKIEVKVRPISLTR